MNEDTVCVRAVALGDRPAWERLYRGYAAFYQVPMEEAVLDATWRWLMDPQRRVEGLVALQRGELVGLAHFRAFPEPLLGQELGFLDDLFVPPAHRGQGTGRKLIEAVAAIARERGWPVLRWITAEDNAHARRFYNQMAHATPWVTYDLDPRQR